MPLPQILCYEKTGGIFVLKAAIVEDEKILLDDLEEIIDWESLGVEIAYTERNGVNALRHITREPVDIVITDIRMPVMSGVEMAKKLREQDKNVQIIFLTGYEEVGYMKSAISVDAVAYLQKPLQEKELQDAVTAAVERIEQIKNARIGKEKRMESELMEVVLHDTKETPLLGDGIYTLALAGIGRFQTMSHTRSAAEINWILERVRENLQNFYQYRSGKVIIAYISKGQFVIAAEDTEGYIRYGEAELAELNEGLENLCRISLITTGEDTVYEPEQMYPAYRKILKRQEDSFYCGVRPRNLERETLAERKRQICSEIHKMTEVQVMTKLDEFFRQAAYDKVPRAQMLGDCFEICCGMYDGFFGGQKPKEVLNSEKRELAATLEEFDNFGQIRKYVGQFYLNITQKEDQEGDLEDEEKIVQKIISYINRHYAEPISAESLVEEVYFASNTIRLMIKKQTGSTVHEYLTKVRMEKATELLRSRDKKVKQIAKEVGYDNVSYFCMRFSKDYGMSPLAYRKKYFQNRGNGENTDT